MTVSVGKIFYRRQAITINGSGTLVINSGFRFRESRVAPSPAGDDVISTRVELRGNPDIHDAARVRPGLWRRHLQQPLRVQLALKSRWKTVSARTQHLSGDHVHRRGQLLLDFQDDVNKIRQERRDRVGRARPGLRRGSHRVEAPPDRRRQPRVRQSQGLLTIDANEHVGETVVNDGFITIRTDAGYFAPASLNMTGGVIESRTNGGLYLKGDVTATSSQVKGAARIFPRLRRWCARPRREAAPSPSPTDRRPDMTCRSICRSVTRASTASPSSGTGRSVREGSTPIRAARRCSTAGSAGVSANLPAIAGELCVGVGRGPPASRCSSPTGFQPLPLAVGVNGTLAISTTTPIIGPLFVRAGRSSREASPWRGW